MNFVRTSLLPNRLVGVAILLFPFALVALAGRKQPEPQVSGQVTFSHDIAPIVFRSCAPCHHPGEAGPFALVSYGDVKSHARQIADVTSRRLMPPWLPSEDGLQFAEDSHLSGEQIALFQRWIADCEPKRAPAHGEH